MSDRVWMSGEHGTVVLPEGERPDWAPPLPKPVLYRPDESDKKAVWVEYAESLGIENPDTMTKDEIIALTEETE